MRSHVSTLLIVSAGCAVTYIGTDTLERQHRTARQLPVPVGGAQFHIFRNRGVAITTISRFSSSSGWLVCPTNIPVPVLSIALNISALVTGPISPPDFLSSQQPRNLN